MFCTGWHSHQKVDQGKFQNSLVIRHYVKRGHYWKESPKTVEWPASASLEPEMFWRQAKFFLHCWQASGGKSSRTKYFTPKCLRLKWLLRRTQWSHSKISLRTMGLGRVGVGSSGLGFLNLSMQNVSLTGCRMTTQEFQHILYQDHSIRQGLCSCTVVVHPWWDLIIVLRSHDCNSSVFSCHERFSILCFN